MQALGRKGMDPRSSFLRLSTALLYLLGLLGNRAGDST